MQGGEEDTMRPLEDPRRRARPDSYCLVGAELEVRKMKEFFNGLYAGKRKDR